MTESDYRRVPRTRGDEPLQRTRRQRSGCVFPARAGMNRMSEIRASAPPVFPARAGMNRSIVDDRRMPRWVFPARAGMNRRRPS